MLECETKMKTENEPNRKSEKPQAARPKKKPSAAKGGARGANLSGELDENRWSVVTFESRAAKNLTYDEAARKLEELRAKKIPGLCVVTDEAGARLVGKAANRERK